MANVIKADMSGKGKKFAIVISRINEFISTKLLEGCLDTLARHGAEDKAQDVIWVPGAFEIPLLVKAAAESKRYQSILALGVILEGETAHADLIARGVTQALLDISLANRLPVIHCVLLLQNEEQAKARCLASKGNRGTEAAQSAVATARTVREFF